MGSTCFRWITSAPRTRRASLRDSSRLSVKTSKGPSTSNKRARGSRRSCRSRITRVRVGAALPRRRFSLGSSAIVVPIPMRIASCSSRSSSAQCRPWGEEIHWLSPVAVAIRPSRLMAHFKVTAGRSSSSLVKNARFKRRASWRCAPTETSTPASFNRSKPLPATLGSGSPWQATTRATPAPIRASVQGGVRP